MRRGLVGLAVVFVSNAAQAQAPAASALFDQGRVALAAGDLDTACARFRASDQLDPAGGTRANLGACEQKRGRIASAWEAYRSALRLFPQGDPRAAKIRAWIAELEPRLPWLTLELDPDAPAATTVRLGAVIVGNTATWKVAMPFDPGVHELIIEAPGKASRVVRTTLGEGERTTIAVRFTEKTAEPPAKGPAERKFLVRMLGDEPTITLFHGETAVCRAPCVRKFSPGSERFAIGGEGVTHSDPFEINSDTTLRVRAGSSGKRAGGIVMIVLGGVATIAGAGLVAAGALAEEQTFYGSQRVAHAPAIGGGIATMLAGAGLIVGGVVLVKQSRTEITTSGASPFAFRF